MNISFVKYLEQMPVYAKFMKDVVTKNRTMSFDPMDNLHHCSAIFSLSLIKKKEDLRAFTILCTIRFSNFARSLCDLGASINLIT